MNIVFASDAGYLRQLLVATCSAVRATRDDTERLDVHVLDCGIPDGSWEIYAATVRRLADDCGANAEIMRHVVDLAPFANLDGWTNGSKATWARLLIPKILPNVDSCVYSDCDMLFIDSPRDMLKTLRQSPDALIAGHLDLRSSRSQASEWCRRNGLSGDEKNYVCCGLLAMNLKAFREEGLVAKCLDFATRHPGVRYPDQTTLNQVCLGRTATLSDGWGLFPQECHIFDGRIKSIHFAGGYPWRTRCESPNVVLGLRQSGEECALWRDFETRILNLPPSAAVRPSLKLRLIERTSAICARTASLLGIRIGHGSFQDALAAFGHHTSALARARQELFGDSSSSADLSIRTRWASVAARKPAR
jgi:lipopolysaccharide biosynthesis glycosyltransferase